MEIADIFGDAFTRIKEGVDATLEVSVRPS
jgi:hypothetical protein